MDHIPDIVTNYKGQMLWWICADYIGDLGKFAIGGILQNDYGAKCCTCNYMKTSSIQGTEFFAAEDSTGIKSISLD